MSFTPRKLIIGSLIPTSIDQSISIIVQVINVKGLKLECETTDGKEIIVNINEPLTSQTTNWVEVIGTVSSANTINCTEIIEFEDDKNAERFDRESHNMMVHFLNNCKDLYSVS